MSDSSLLVVNVGSSSVRLTELVEGRRRDRHLEATDASALAVIEIEPALVIHRLVHGGPRLRATTELDDAAQAELRLRVELAPLHLPRELAWVEAARRRWPRARQLGAFDTAFYADLPAAAATYALSAELRRRFDLLRYGFHGLAHQSMLRQLPGYARVISFQLGSDASATASRDARPLDTSMGFSPLEGLVMATRPGDLDAGILLHLLRAGWPPADLERLLEHEAGLRGLAGDGDMRALLARSDREAQLAIDVYVHRARRYLGAFLAVLGGCDAIAFGGGVGENAPAIRAAILAGAEWAGIRLDATANARGHGRISSPDSAVAVHVTPVDEAAVLADEANAFVTPGRPR